MLRSRSFVSLGGVAALLVGGPAVSARATPSNLMVVDSEADLVHIVSGTSGRPIEFGAYDINAAVSASGYVGLTTPKEPMEVGDEVWVSDISASRIWRFDRDTRAPLTPITRGPFLQGVRGFDVAGDTAYFAIGSSGPFASRILRYDIPSESFTGELSGDFDVPAQINIFDVVLHDGVLFATNAANNADAVLRFGLDGTRLADFVTSDGLTSFDSAQQLSFALNGDALVASGGSPTGVWRFASDGTPLGRVAGGSVNTRAGYELPDGRVLYATSLGLRASGDFSTLIPGDMQFINPISIPAPGVAGFVLASGVTMMRRRRA